MNDFTKEELERISQALRIMYKNGWDNTDDNYPCAYDIYDKTLNMIADYCDHRPLFDLNLDTNIHYCYCTICKKDLLL